MHHILDLVPHAHILATMPQILDSRYTGGVGEFLVEEELEGEYTKWWVVSEVQDR
jgi:hypothetical protein